MAQPGDSSYAEVAKTISEPSASPSYANVASRSPEQVEAIKAAQAAGAGSKQPPKKPVQKPVQKPRPRRKAASEPPSTKTGEKSAEQRKDELKTIHESNREHNHNADREGDRSRGRGAIGTASENVLLRVIASGTMSVIVVAITPVSVIVTDPAGVVITIESLSPLARLLTMIMLKLSVSIVLGASSGNVSENFVFECQGSCYPC